MVDELKQPFHLSTKYSTGAFEGTRCLYFTLVFQTFEKARKVCCIAIESCILYDILINFIHSYVHVTKL